MKKQLKRIGALALALVFALCLTLPAFADPSSGEEGGEEEPPETTQTNPVQTTSTNTGTGSITIKNVQAGKTYDIYRILNLAMSEKSRDAETGEIQYNYAYEINTGWDDFFFPSGEAGKYIKTEAPTEDPVPLTYKNAQYYIVISDAAAFAQEALDYATGLDANDGTATLDKDKALTVASDNIKVKNGNLTFSNIALGYYLVYPQGAAVKKSGNASICSLDSAAKDMEVDIKAEYPTIDKKADVQDKVVGIGDVVTFTITGKVPDTTGYKSYTYKITDTMSTGLAYKYDEDDKTDGMTVAIMKTGADGTEEVDYTLTKGETFESGDYTLDVSGQVLTLNIDVIKLQKYVGQNIKVTYTTKVTKDAVGTNIKNDAKLTYSNDPNASGDGEKGEDNTPDKGVQLYTVNVQVYAYAGVDEPDDKYKPETALKGAVYVLSNEDGKYYHLKTDGTVEWVATTEEATQLTTGSDGFTGETNATEIEEKKADNTNNTNESKETTETNNSDNTNDTGNDTGNDITETDQTGQPTGASVDGEENKTNTKYRASLNFKGLGAGTYTLKEIKTPEGYNRATDTPFTVKENNSEGATEKVSVDGGAIYLTDDYLYQIDVNHKTGALLPSTGGMGTKLFYIIGAALLIGAGVLLVVRRRMGDEE